MSLPNTTISSANSLKLSNVCRGVGINWATNLKTDCFLPQRTLSKIWVSSDHSLAFFYCYWYHALGAHSKSGYLVFYTYSHIVSLQNGGLELEKFCWVVPLSSPLQASFPPSDHPSLSNPWFWREPQSSACGTLRHSCYFESLAVLWLDELPNSDWPALP